MRDFTPKVTVVTVVLNCVDHILKTIESVANQTYPNVEHVVVDGGSEDGTLDVIKEHEDLLDLWVSEPDEGVYDAINKGIRLATGEYVVILHASDVYSPDYISRLVAAAVGRPGVVVYADYLYKDTYVSSSGLSDGIFLHHLGVNHSTFLVPRGVYGRVGVYDARRKIVSDAIWMRRAVEMGVPFHKIEGAGLVFADGGLSSAHSEKQRALIIAEWVSSYRIFFPFLPDDVAESLYLYRFEESQGDRVLAYVSHLVKIRQHPACHPTTPLFLRSLAIMLAYIWRARTIKDDPTFFDVRWELCRLLGVSRSEIGVEFTGVSVSDVLTAFDAIKAAVAGKSVILHYLEVFSRPSEPFIPDLINRWSERDGRAHVVLCDQRVLASVRRAGAIIALDPNTFGAFVYKRLVEHLIDELKLKAFVFHFAINGWRLLDRIGARFQNVAAVYMTHGVDVFDLGRSPEYRQFLIGSAAKSPNVHFTAVSRYLAQALVAAGAPAEKVSLVHNVAHPRFFEHRRAGTDKAAGHGSGLVRLVNVGRLVPLKGQQDIIRALTFLLRQGVNAELTLVYGGEALDLDRLRQLAESEGVADRVVFRPFVNFDSEPDFFNDFDILVSASTYTTGEGARSESFGMSILEGIAAGLPVVVTDAGGQAEVAGPCNDYVRIARHSDPASLAEEISQIVACGALGGDNLSIAEERIAWFSAERQIDLLESALSAASGGVLRPLLFSTALDGGAGGAAKGVHLALLAAGAPSTMVFRNLIDEWRGVPGVVPLDEADVRVADAVQPVPPFLRTNHTIFSVDTMGIAQEALERLVADRDVINLHWYARFLSSDNIAWLTNCGKPVIFTIRDMHPLTGGCHFFHGCDNWQDACLPCPQFQPINVDLPHAQFAHKRDNWNFDNVTIVTLSEHTRKIVEQSPLIGGCRIETIPNPIDTTVFRPMPQGEARDRFNLPRERRIISYIPSFDSAVKGAAEFEAMLKRLARDVPAEDLLVVCAGRRTVALDGPFEIRQLGHIGDRNELATFYSAADVTVVPSLEETFSNTALESIACGTPVAGFATGAIPTFAQGPRGRAAPVGDVVALATAVRDLLEAAEQCPREDNHAYAVQNYSPERVGAAYLGLFSELVERKHEARDVAGAGLSSAMSEYLTARLESGGGVSQVDHRRRGPALALSPFAAPGAVVDLATLSKRKGVVSDVAGGLRIEAQDDAGHRLHGPNIRLPAGRYRLDLELSSDWKKNLKHGLRSSRAVVEIVWNVDEVLASETFNLAGFGGRVRWRPLFEIGAAQAANFQQGFEVRIWTDGRQPWSLNKLLLRGWT